MREVILFWGIENEKATNLKLSSTGETGHSLLHKKYQLTMIL